MNSLPSKRNVPVSFIIALFALIVVAQFLVFASPVHANATTTETTTNEILIVFEVNPDAAGSTAPSGNATYAPGASISILATANSGYAFTGWTVSDASAITLADPSLASTTATVNDFGTITANFSPTTMKPADTQTVVTCDPRSVAAGSSTTCTATVSDGGFVSGQTVSWTSTGTGAFDSSDCALSSSGACTIEYTPTEVGDGSHTITANYAGDASHLNSTDSLTLTVTSGTVVVTTTSTATTSGAATVWTDQADYAPVDTPIIYGSGFLPNANITISVTRPEGTVNTWFTISDGSGGFQTTYATDGLVLGTFTVTATDGTNTATTAFTDKLSTTTTLSVPASGATLTAGSTGNSWSGTVTPASGTIPAGVDVDLYYVASTTTCPTSGVGGGTSLGTTTTASGGGFGGSTTTFTAPAAGYYNFYARFKGNNNYADSNSACNSITVTSAKSDQTITVTTHAPTSAAYGASFGVAATASSGLPVAITTSGSCSGSGSGSATITMTGATGTCTVHYNQAGDSSNNAAPEVTENTGAQKAAATISVTPYSVTFDGNAHTATGSATGVKGESLSGLVLTGTTHTIAGDYPTDAWTFTDSTGNYNDASGTVHDSISKAAATIVVTPYDVTYDGNAHTATGTATGVKGESLSGLDLSGTTHTNAGTYTGDAWTFTGGTNYKDASGTVSDKIGRADATLSVNGYTGIYDGNAHGASGTATGVKSEDLSGSLDLGAKYTNVPGGTAHWTFTGGTNYNDASGDVAIEISKADAAILVTPYSVTYDGDPHTATGTATGAKGESLSGLDLTGTTHTDAGDYPTDAWAFADVTGNYNDASGTVSDKISKADAIITVNGYTGVYDRDAHGATGTATGVKGEDLSSSLNLGSSFTDVPGGTAHWTFAGGTNYNDASGDVSIVISKATALISVTPYSVTYDGSAHTATGSATGVGGVSLTGFDLSGTTHTIAGDYPTDAWTFTGGTNYKDASGTVHDSIGKADATIVVTPYDVPYDGNAHAATGSAKGVKGESLSGLDLSGTTHTAAGTYTGDAWTFTDATGNYKDASGTVDDKISPKATTVSITPPSPVQYSDPITLSATVSPVSVGDQTLTGSVEFSISGNPVGSSPIDGSGVATLPNIENFRASGDYDVTAKFTSSNSNFADSNGGPVKLTINKENVGITYTGDTFVVTGDSSSATVRLSAKLVQDDDGHLGDITKAKVTFELFKSSNLGSTADYTFSGIAVDSNGVAQTTRSISADVWTVRVKIDPSNEYWQQSEVAFQVLTVTTSTSSSITGGGWITDGQSANGKGNFGFTVSYSKNGGTKGNFVYVYRGTDGYDYIVKSNSWQGGGLAFTGTNTASFTGKCVIQKVNRVSGAIETSWGNSKFAVNIFDGDLNSAQKGSDTIAITFSDPSATISRTILTSTLGGGNIVVHSK